MAEETITPPDAWQQVLDYIAAKKRILQQAKRNDYVGDRPDPLANYQATADFLGTTVELVLLGRAFEKMQRVKVLLSGTKAQVSDETIEDTLLDISIIAELIIARRMVLADDKVVSPYEIPNPLGTSMTYDTVTVATNTSQERAPIDNWIGETGHFHKGEMVVCRDEACGVRPAA